MKIRRILAVGLLAGISFGAMAGAARADPISAAIVTAIGFTAGTTAFAAAVAVSNFALGIAGNIGLSLLGGALRKKPKSSGGVQAQLESGVETYRTIGFGDVATRGTWRYFKGVGKSNKVVHLVYQLFDWECDSLIGIWVNGIKKTLQPVSVVGTEHARFEVSDFGANMVVKFFRGTFPQTADSEIVTASADTDGQSIGSWTSDHRGDGICYVSLRLQYDKNLFQGGIPNFLFEVRGAKLYDIRKDSTAGGSGAHRWNDPSTWEFSKNPAVMDYNFCRGFYRNGVRLLGKGDQPTDLLTTTYIASMNVCDEVVTEGAGTGARYEASIIATDEAEHRTFIEDCRVAMAADVIESGGLTGPLAGATYSPVATIYDDDVVTDETSTYSLDPDQMYNAVTCKFTNPAIEWRQDDLPMLTNTTWEQDDGNERVAFDVDLPSVIKSFQAARIQKIVHEQSRMSGRVSETLHPKFWGLEPGDWVTRVFNRTGKPTMTMKVVAMNKADDGCVRLSLRQCAASNFVAPSGTPVTSLVPVVVPYQRELLLTGFGASAGFVASAGQSRPTLNVVWTAPADPAIVAVQVEYRLLNNALSLRAERVAPPGAGVVLAADILAASTYQIRIRPEFENGEVGTWTGYAEVLTSTEFSVLSSRIALDTESYFKQMWSDYSVSPLAHAVEKFDRYIEGLDAKSEQARDIMSVANSSNTILATVETLRQVVITGDASLATSISEVSANLALLGNSLGATSTIAQSAETSAATANAAAMSAASVALAAQSDANDATATGLFKVSSSATGSGALASVAALVRVATSGTSLQTTYVQAGWILDVFQESPGVYKGRMVVEANYFAIKTSGLPFVPFAVIGSDTYIQSLLVGGNLSSENFLSGVRGYQIRPDGTAEFQSITVGGGTSTSRPFELAMGAFQGGVLTDEPVSSFDRTVTLSTYVANAGGVATSTTTLRAYGFVRRSPTYVQYDITTVYNSVTKQFSRVVPKARNVAWAPLVLAVGSFGNAASGGTAINTAGIEFTSSGEMRAISTKESSNGAAPDMRNTAVSMITFLSSADVDPFFSGSYNASTIHIWKSDGIKGVRRFRVPETVLVSGTPTAVVGMDVWMWGSAARRTNAFTGGPGGFVKFRRAISPGQILSALIGDSEDDGFPGHGFNTQTNENLFTAGGATFLWNGIDTRPNLIAVAGGGGAGGAGGNGGCGGSTSFGGGNGSSATDMTRCFGLGGAYSGGIPGYGGGGGYEGGGMNASPQFGRGGTSYTDGTCTAVTASIGGQGASGNWTSGVPGSSESVYTANSAYADMPNVATPNTVNGPGGAGMLCIQFLTSL